MQQLKQHQVQAQNWMKQLADRKRREVIFKLGDLVMVKLQPYRQSTVAKRLNTKLCRRYFGPFLIVVVAGPVAYILQLPPSSKIYPTFHVSLWKAFKGDEPVKYYPLPKVCKENKPIIALIAMIATRVQNNQGHPVKQVLVQWSHRWKMQVGRISQTLASFIRC